MANDMEKMQWIKDTQAKQQQQQQLDFFIRTSTPPAEMVLFEGDFYTARVALENLVSTAAHRVISLFLDAHIDIRKWRKESHDRWLVIDDTLYHCGHSLNANGGHKLSAITRMGTSPDVILAEMELLVSHRFHRKHLKDKNDLHRSGKSFLLSEKAESITWQNIHVDNGTI